MDAPDIHLVSVGTALPGPPIDNAAVARRFGMDRMWEQWVDAFIGTRTRHLAVDIDSGEQVFTLTDLCVIAANRALASAGISPSDVDLVVLGTATPDMLMPATVNLVADELGINEVSTYQMQSGCAGAFQALDVAAQLLRTGRHRTALVLGGDVCAKHLDLDIDIAGLAPAQLVNFVLFGDGAGAAVLSAEPVPGSLAIRELFVRFTGLGREPGQIIEWFGAGESTTSRPAGSEDYKAIEASVPVMSEEILAELLDRAGWKSGDIDYLLAPQLSGRMTAKIVERLAVPSAEAVNCVRDTGNNGNALPFLQLELAMPLMRTGDRAIGISVESSKWIKAGIALEKV